MLYFIAAHWTLLHVSVQQRMNEVSLLYKIKLSVKKYIDLCDALNRPLPPAHCSWNGQLADNKLMQFIVQV